MSSQLWHSSDVHEWQSHLDAYDQVRSEQLSVDVKTLDDWYRFELAKGIQTRKPPHMKKSELSKLMEWKLQVGKWRPRLQKFIDNLEEADIISATTEAFSACESTAVNKFALQSAMKLKGVGPATASAILSVYQPQFYPFMSDEALNATAGEIGKRDYTLPHYLRFSAALQEKAKCLRENSHSKWTAQQVQMCLWVNHHQKKSEEAQPKAGEGSSSRPRREKRQRTK